MKITIKNFQAIADTEIDIKGFTVLTGKSNLGKSAALRAIEGAFFGIPGDYYVKHGSAQSEVEIDDPEIKWNKVEAGKVNPNRTTSLEIDGTKYTKIGKDHQNLTACLKVIEIKAGTERLRPQFANQHDPIFLVSQNEGVAAEVLKMLGRTDIITDAQKNARKDLRDLESLLSVRRGDYDLVASEFEVFKVFPELQIEFNLLKKQEESVSLFTKKIEFLLLIIEEYAELPDFHVPEIILTPKLSLIELGTISELESLKTIEVPNAIDLPTISFTKLGQIIEYLSLPSFEIPEALISNPLDTSILESLIELSSLMEKDKSLSLEEAELAKMITNLLKEEKRLKSLLKICPICEKEF